MSVSWTMAGCGARPNVDPNIIAEECAGIRLTPLAPFTFVKNVARRPAAIGVRH